LFCAVQVTYKRLQETLQQLSGPGTDRRADTLPGMALVDALFDRREPRFAAAVPAWKAVNARLDESQRRAVELALRAQDVALIHGPPGVAVSGYHQPALMCRAHVAEWLPDCSAGCGIDTWASRCGFSWICGCCCFRLWHLVYQSML
jgi:hypothetical protein